MSDFEEDIITPPTKHPEVVILYDCYICYEETTNIVMLSCRHEICLDCINQLTSLSCPFCRHELTTKDVSMKTYLMIKNRMKEAAREYQEESMLEFLESEQNSFSPSLSDEGVNTLLLVFYSLFTPIHDT